jgi:hypothetical protein
VSRGLGADGPRQGESNKAMIDEPIRLCEAIKSVISFIED